MRFSAKLLSVLAIALFQFECVSQDLSLYGGDTLRLANTAAEASYLSAEEKKVIQLINLARLDGKSFIQKVALPYAKANDLADDDFLESLFDDLQHTKGLHTLKPNNKLWQSAAFHAHDMGHKGLFGYESSDGTSLMSRLKRFHAAPDMGESLVYGYDKAFDIVMQLLLDEGIETKTNRHHILSESYHLIGLSIKPHKVYDFNCVMDFANL